MSAPHLSERDLQCIESAQHWREGGVEMLDAPDAGRIADHRGSRIHTRGK